MISSNAALYVLVFLISQTVFADWVQTALRLTGESESVRRKSIESLRNESALEDKLRNALKTPRKFLALDVISALKMQSMLPDLIAYSGDDQSGATYLAINALTTVGNRNDVAELYKRRLLRPSRDSIGVTSQVIMLDTLARMKEPLHSRQVKELMLSPHFEVRSAALYYIRHLTLGKKVTEIEPAFLECVRHAFKSSPYQLRAQALALYKEYPNDVKSELSDDLAFCDSEKEESVRAACKEFRH